MWMRPKVGFLIELLPHTFVPTTYAELCEQFDVGYRVRLQMSTINALSFPLQCSRKKSNISCF